MEDNSNSKQTTEGQPEEHDSKSRTKEEEKANWELLLEKSQKDAWLIW